MEPRSGAFLLTGVKRAEGILVPRHKTDSMESEVQGLADWPFEEFVLKPRTKCPGSRDVERS